jgi:hypothetical protein
MRAHQPETGQVSPLESDGRAQASSAAMTTITLEPSDLAPFRAMLREQMSGDHEQLRDLRAGAKPRTPEVYGEAPTIARLQLVERLTEAVGGLY